MKLIYYARNVLHSFNVGNIFLMIIKTMIYDIENMTVYSHLYGISFNIREHILDERGKLFLRENFRRGIFSSAKPKFRLISPANFSLMKTYWKSKLIFWKSKLIFWKSKLIFWKSKLILIFFCVSLGKSFVRENYFSRKTFVREPFLHQAKISSLPEEFFPEENILSRH